METIITDQKIEEKKINVFRPNWNQISQGAILIELHIGYWRAQTNLSLEDLGLEKAPEEYKQLLKENINLGSKRLIPKAIYNELSSLESKARDTLYKDMIPSPWGYLLPKKNYMTWKEEMEGYKEKIFEIRDKLYFERDNIVEKMREEYQKAALYAYRVSSGQDVNGESEPPEEFTERFVSSILSRIPSAEEIRDSFHFDWVPSYVLTPSELEEEKIKAEKARQDWDDQKAEGKEENKLALAERQLDFEIRQKTMTSKLSRVDQTLDLIASSLRETLYEAVVNALEIIKKNDNLGGGARTLRTIASRIRNLNFMDDEDIESYLVKIEALIDSKIPTKDRSIAETQNTLKEIGTIIRGELLALGSNPRTGKELEIPDVIDAERVRKSRKILFGETPEELSTQRNQRSL